MIPDGEDFTWTVEYKDGSTLTERAAHEMWDGTPEGAEHSGWKAVKQDQCTKIRVFHRPGEIPVAELEPGGAPFVFMRRRRVSSVGDPLGTLTVCGWPGNFMFFWSDGRTATHPNLEAHQQ
jgi:hypothetical protein